MTDEKRSHPPIVKAVEVSPGSVTNEGSARVRLQATTFTPRDEGRILRVEAHCDGLWDRRDGALEPLPEAVLASGEGRYVGAVSVRYLADPGPHEVEIKSLDDRGQLGRRTAPLHVRYARPELRGERLADRFSLLARRAGLPGPVRAVEGALLFRGEDAWKARLDLIEAARFDITVFTYTMALRGRMQEMVQALVEAARRGVEVNLALNLPTQLATSPGSGLWVGLREAGTNLLTWARQQRGAVEEGSLWHRWLGELIALLTRLGYGAPTMRVVLVDDDIFLGGAPGGSPPSRIGPWLRRLRRDRTAWRRAQGSPGFAWSAAGPGQVPPIPLADYALHEKVFAVDGAAAIVGGRNLEDRYFESWIDADVLVEGDLGALVGRTMWERFRRYAERSGLVPPPPPPGRDGLDRPPRGHRFEAKRARFLSSLPWEGRYATMEGLVALIQAAERHILLVSQYVALPDSLLKEALFEAARRGVRVQLVTNGREAAREVNLGAGFYLTLNYLRDLLDAGIEVYASRGAPPGRPPHYLHAKVFVFDAEVAAIGSFNVTVRSCFVESEALVVIEDPSVAAWCLAEWGAYLRSCCEPVDLQRLEGWLKQHEVRVSLARSLELLY